MGAVIDVHTHMVPSRLAADPKRDRRWPSVELSGADQAAVMIAGKVFRKIDTRCWDVDRRLSEMVDDGTDMQVLSPMPELLSYWFTPSDGLEMARWMNHTIASMVSTAPARFAGFGIVPLQDPALAAAELARLKRDGFNGAEIGRWLVCGPDAESVELGDNADVGLTLRYHLELGWPEVDVVGFLSGLHGHVRDWVVAPLACEIGR